jgi:NADH:ubiquinone oxidoreductase subunit F (NADH-binding)
MSDALALPRLLRGIERGGALTLDQHRRVHGDLPTLARGDRERLLDAIERSGLRGRGGGHVSTALKLRAVAGRRRRAIVVANGAESEPASRKDAVLLARSPHLVIDGALVAAAAVGADEIVVYVKQAQGGAWRAASRALAERRGSGAQQPKLRLAPAGTRYVSGQETAVISHLGGRSGLPTSVPPRPFERGLRNRPTLICNVETLAHVALIARHGPDWFRTAGSRSQPGTALVTVGGAVAHPGVCEIAFGTSFEELLHRAGGVTERPRALLVGGYGGTWLDARHMSTLTLGDDDPVLGAGSIGAGVLWVLGERSCGVLETARILDYLAAQSAGQCGPCVHGLRAIADSFDARARGGEAAGERAQLRRWAAEVGGRGACRHPDGAARFLATALEVFATEIDDHQTGRCTAAHGPTLPLPSERRVAA